MEQPSSKKKTPLKPHAFIANLVRDENKPPKLRIVSGYIGKAAKADSTRIYLDAELRRFVDIPNEEIMHTEDSRTDKAPLATVHVWVRETAQIRHFGNWIGSEDPTTMATGEEGGGDPTTMATGEESTGPINPGDLLINPFGSFR